MAYPQTSAEEIRDLQERNGQLQRLLRRYHASVQAYVALEHPVPQEETAFFEQMLDLLHDTEDLIETGDEAPEHNFAAEAQEATHISDVEQRWYQCDEDDYDGTDPDYDAAMNAQERGE